MRYDIVIKTYEKMNKRFLKQKSIFIGNFKTEIK